MKLPGNANRWAPGSPRRLRDHSGPRVRTVTESVAEPSEESEAGLLT